MFDETKRLLDGLHGKSTYTMKIDPDSEGYIDKECPNKECLSKFKVLEEDWKVLFADDTVYCPFCGFAAPAKSWWTTEQIKQAEHQARAKLAAAIGRALEKDASSFNRTAPKGFVKLSMKFSGMTYAPNLPASALEEMEQKVQCEKCGAHYAVIGSAFFCPCCRCNSARYTFQNTIDKVKAKIKNLETIYTTVAKINKDDAARTCASLLETSIPDIVIAIQRVCECVYPTIDGAKPLKQNIFQRLDDGDKLWTELIGVGYHNWISDSEYNLLKRCFQERHILQHKEGIIDQDYIDKSGDIRYTVGQRLIIRQDEINDYLAIAEKLGKQVINARH
ncbi:MAG: hypothetical protein LLF96_10820 [Eubacteriales bacterium]|nr:hypothetical protein [Eubacteriales bacterium]